MFTKPLSTDNSSKPSQGPSVHVAGEDASKPERGICSAARLAAELYAIRKANTCGIPQTVFRSTHADEWQHTNPFAAILAGADTFITILPSKYFQ
jgi:hypothetical protein